MGSLRELTSDKINVHLSLSNSSLADIYVYDTLKELCKATLESVINVESRADFKVMLELVNMQSYLSDKWLFVINYSKVKGLCKSHKGIFGIKSAVFLIKVKNYKEFKEFKELIPTCNDLYLPIMRKNDVAYLFKDLDISQKVLNFVATSYSRDSEKIFELRKELLNGVEIEDQRSVVKLLGVSTGSVNKVIFLLLANPPSTEKGFSRVFKKRVQVCTDLINAYGTRSLRNFMLATTKDILQIKTLYMQGVIYKSIRDLPEQFDEKRLSKYNYYLETIENEIPYERIMKLYLLLQEDKVWYSAQDVLSFLYKYYGGVSDEIISRL